MRERGDARSPARVFLFGISVCRVCMCVRVHAAIFICPWWVLLLSEVQEEIRVLGLTVVAVVVVHGWFAGLCAWFQAVWQEVLYVCVEISCSWLTFCTHVMAALQQEARQPRPMGT